MCGICGIVTNNGSTPDTSLIVRMRDSMVHRGPDGAGIHTELGVALGHRRLSIVDVAHGQQPMYSADRRYVVVYNGEIFNHPELQAQFESTGVHYRTRSDTETLLHLFEHYGVRAVEKMRGMFAFAVWDTHERTLCLARDRFGVKPLYYMLQPDGGIIFGSEIKVVLAGLPGRASLNLNVLPEFLANHAPSGDQTFFNGIQRLPPGHTLVWRAGGTRIEPYWDLSYGRDVAPPRRGSRQERDVVEEFRSRFTEAVRLRLMSDVPLGMFLSGGIDSAAITATMATLTRDPIQTFSVAFAEREANELAYARMVADAYRTNHREVVVSPDDFFDKLLPLTWHEDEPIAHPSSIALYFVSRLAASHVKVVLTGEGSDEMLAGYNRYRVTVYNAMVGSAYDRWLPRRLRRGVKSCLSSFPADSWLRRRLDRTFIMRGAALSDLYFDNFAVFARAEQSELLAPPVAESVSGVDPYAAYLTPLARMSGKPLLSQLLYADVKTYLHELLMKQDQMSMAASIESRVPFLDHIFAQWVADLPLSFKLRGTTTKWILREAMRGRLPDPILGRRKMGFPVPVGAWLRGRWRPLLDNYLLGDRATNRGIFNPSVVRRLVDEHQSGRSRTDKLWALLTFEAWARVFLDGEKPRPLASSL